MQVRLRLTMGGRRRLPCNSIKLQPRTAFGRARFFCRIAVCATVQPRRSAGPHRLRGLEIAAVAYCLVLLVLLFLENMLVYPAPRYPEGDWQATWLEHEDISFNSADGTKLHGWYVEHPQPKAVILYCHGNGTPCRVHRGISGEMRDEFRFPSSPSTTAAMAAARESAKRILEDAEAAQELLARRAGIGKGYRPDGSFLAVALHFTWRRKIEPAASSCKTRSPRCTTRLLLTIPGCRFAC
jgi:hypothetical protein